MMSFLLFTKRLGIVMAVPMLCAWGDAGAAKLSGVILGGQGNDKVIEANVYIPQLELRARSNLDGRFALEIVKRGHYRLEVTHISYEKQIVDLDIGDKDVDLTIHLTPRTYIADDIVVTGTRTPYLLKDVPVTTEVIRTEEAKRTGATTVDQALKSAVGVNVDDNLGGVGASLRGIDPTRVLILIDGEKMVGRINGTIDLAQIPLDNVEKIEVVKGVGSTLYGSDAIGGVINVITRKPESLLRIYSIGEYGSFNTYTQQLDMESKRGPWGLQVGSKFDRTDGFDLDKSTPQTNGMERIKRLNLTGKVNRALSRSFDVTLKGDFLREHKKWLESEFVDPITYLYNDNEMNYRYTGGGKLQFNPDPKTTGSFSLYSTYYDHLWEKFFERIKTDRSRTEEFLSEGSAVATHSYKEGHVVTTGADWSFQSLKTEQIAAGKRGVKSGDLYMQYEWKPVSNFTLLPGIRYERHSTYGSHVNASINAMYNPHPRVRLRAFYGGGFRAPSIKEIYFRFDHSAAGYIVEGGGADLKPERSKNSSITLEYSYAGIGLHRLTYFYNHLDDLIEFDLVGFSDKYWRGMYRYRNVFKAYTKGIEWQSEIKINHSMNFSLSYTRLIAKNLQTHNWLLNRPEHSLKLSYSIDFRKAGMTTTVWGSWYSEKLWVPLGAQNDFNSNIWAPARREINLSVTKRLWKYLEAYGRVQNATNDINVTYGYWPAKSYYAGLRWNFDRSE